MPREDNKESLGLVVTEVDSRVALLCHASAIATDSSTHPEKIFQWPSPKKLSSFTGMRHGLGLLAALVGGERSIVD